MPASDLQQEAADYAELQMDGRDGGGLCSAHGARERSFPPGYTAAGCSSPQSTGEAGERRHSSLSAISFSITVKSSDLGCADMEYLSTQLNLSFDTCGHQSVLKRVGDKVHVARRAHMCMHICKCVHTNYIHNTLYCSNCTFFVTLQLLNVSLIHK